MATLAELEDALANADAAGDTEAATALADEIVRMQSRPSEKSADKPSATFKDRALALGGGINKGIVSTFTLPVDTTANIVDVGNAALGAGYLGADKINRAFGGDGVDIPAFIKPVDRKKQLGTRENTLGQLQEVGFDFSTPRPDDRTSRVLDVAGQIGGGFVSGGIYNKIPGLTVPPVPGGPPPPPGSPPAPPPAGALGGRPLPAPAGLNATESATLAAGERLGLRATPGARTGSPQLRQIEAALESAPSTSGPLLSLKAGNARVVQREFLKSIGESGDEVSSAALANAADRIGKVFDDVASSSKVAYDDALQDSLAAIGQRASLELTEAEAPIIQRQLNEILTKASNNGGAIDGPAFQNIYSSLGRLSKSGNGSVKDLAGDVREALHDALIRSAGPKVGQKLTTARDQYRILRTAENSGAIDVGSGSIKAGQLGSAFRRTDNAGYQRGYKDSGLYDALRFANTRSFGDIVGNSGTATRANIQGLFDAAKYAGGNLTSRAYLNTPAPLLEGGVNGYNATREVVRGMIGIPKQQGPYLATGVNAAEEDLRKGLLGR